MDKKIPSVVHEGREWILEHFLWEYRLSMQACSYNYRAAGDGGLVEQQKWCRSVKTRSLALAFTGVQASGMEIRKVKIHGAFG